MHATEQRTKGFRADVGHCSACGGKHEGLPFLALLTSSRDWTHFSVCPVNGQRITVNLAGDGSDL